MKVLLLGCGKVWKRRIFDRSATNSFDGDELTTVDMDPSTNADIIMDLNCHPLPFADDTFDEIHAYDVLEHLGRQGDWKGYFDEFTEYHRILKPGGLFYIIVPIGMDALADPGHSRFFHINHFVFLSQEFNQQDQGDAGGVTDYSWYWKKNFAIDFQNQSEHHLAVILRKT